MEKTAALTEHEEHTHDVLEVSIVGSNKIRYKTMKQNYFGMHGDIFHGSLFTGCHLQGQTE